MATTTITGLSAGTALAGTEVAPFDQSGATVKITPAQIKTYAVTTNSVTAALPAFTGDVTTSAGAAATTLATVNSNVGSFTNANVTVNAKGLVTAAANGTAPGMVRLSQVVTTGSQSTITFSSISSAYTNLEIVICGTDTQAGSSTPNFRAQFNGDSTSGNYSSQTFINGNGSSASSGTNAASGAGGVCGFLAQASGTPVVNRILIPSYSATTFTKVLMHNSAGNGLTTTGTFRWNKTAAINAIVFTAGGTAFTDGTTATLYGTL